MSGTSAHGQGHATSFAMIVADRLGIPIEQIRYVQSDTARGADRRRHRRLALAPARRQRGRRGRAAAVRDQARELAAELLEAAPEDLELDRCRVHRLRRAGRGRRLAGPGGRRRGARRRRCTRSSTCRRTARRSRSARTCRSWRSTPRPAGWCRCGTSPSTTAAGSSTRSSSRASSTAGSRRGCRRPCGSSSSTPRTASRSPRRSPTTRCRPRPTRSRSRPPTPRRPTPLNELGAKGIGESGTIGSTPAVQSAVVDALRHLGVRHIDIPCTPERVWRAIQDARAGTLPDPWREPPAVFDTLEVKTRRGRRRGGGLDERRDVSVLIGSGRPWAEIVRIAQAADEAGAYAVYIPDHFMPNTEDGTRSSTVRGWRPGRCCRRCPQQTSSCRLGALVLGGTYRHPAVVANMAASLDHVSGGRAIARARRGLAGQRARGVRHRPAVGPRPLGPVRGERARRGLAAARAADDVRGPVTSSCTTPPTSRRRCRTGCRCWSRASGERRTLRTAAKYADVWHTWGTPESFAAKSAVLDQRCAEVDRDPASIRRATGFFVEDLSDGAATVAPFRDVCDEFVFGDVGAPADDLHRAASLRRAALRLTAPDRMPDVDISVILDNGRPWAEVRELAQTADELGAYAIYLCDHFMGHTDDDTVTDEGMLECDDAAGRARRRSPPRSGSVALVLGGTYRHPAVVANQLTALDHVSGGRAIAGLGAGLAGQRAHGVRHRPDDPARPVGPLRGERRGDLGAAAATTGRTSTGRYFSLHDAPNKPEAGAGAAADPGRAAAARSGPSRRRRSTPTSATSGAHRRGTPPRARSSTRRAQAIGRDPAEIRRATGLRLPRRHRPRGGHSSRTARCATSSWSSTGSTDPLQSTDRRPHRRPEWLSRRPPRLTPCPSPRSSSTGSSCGTATRPRSTTCR